MTVSLPYRQQKGDTDQLLEERAGYFESFLQSFKKSQLDIASEIFDDIARRWKKQSSITTVG